MRDFRNYCVLVSIVIFTTYASPVCDESYSYIEVSEDTPVGTVVNEIVCTRSTAQASPWKLSYVIKDGNTHGKFGVNTTNGIGKVYVYKSISYESRTTHFQLSIEISENGPIRSTTNYVIDIQITGVNDYAPLFLFSPYTVYVNEDKQPGTIISKPIPYDFDKGDDGLTTSVILDGDDSMFYMDPNTAKVYLRSYLDYERRSDYVLTVQVTDNGIPQRRSSTTLLNIHVKDINDNAPVCEESYITETFDESKNAGSVIKYLKCTDADPGNNGRLSYIITEGDYTKFRLQGPYIVLSKEIDVDKEPNVWSLTVVVRDRGNPRLSTLIDIVFYVEGVDDNAPVWAPPENGNYKINIEEHSPIGKLVVRVSADDLDIDKDDSMVVYYMDDYSSLFSINPTTGDIFLSHELDREEGATYTLPVSAVSHSNLLDRISTNVIITVIDVNDNTPVFDKDVFQFFVSEALSDKDKLATVTATDKDEGANGILQYRIMGGNQESLFNIHSKTGDISLMGSLDFETTVTHTVYLQVSDRGRPTRWSTCTVIVSVLPVNEFEPIFTEMETILIAEDTEIGTSVFTVQATDSDSGMDGILAYGVEQSEDKFVVETRTGIVRLLKKLDRETEENFEVYILATDLSQTETKSGSITVKIDVLDRNDNPPICEKSIYAKNLIPPTSSGDIILTVNCTDADDAGNSKLSYSIISGNANSDFSMSTDGNLIIMRKPMSPEYRLEIQVSDNGKMSLDTIVLIVIAIGGTPEIKNLPKKLVISEGVSLGTTIFQVRATSVSEQLEFFIKNIASDKESTSSGTPLIKIDRYSGKIFTWHEFDREYTDHYAIAVNVKETISGIEAEGVIDVSILDLNDNVPMFEKYLYNVSVMESVKVNTQVINLVANDQDINENADLDYTISDGNKENAFVIDGNGVITIRTSIDREKTDLYTLVVTVSDRGKHIRLTGSTTMLVSVLDVDEYSPVFINVGADLETTLPEDTPLAARIFEMKARDLDVHRKLTYSINDAAKEHFIIDNYSGDIFLSRILDRETQDLHTLVVTAEGHDRVVTATIMLSVSDVNDNDPVFSTNIYKFDVHETSMVGDIVGSVVVMDADLGENAFVSISVTKGNIANAFGLNNNNLYVAGILDFEMISGYVLELEARDTGSPQRSSTASVIIQVTPEHRIPKFAIDVELIHIHENVHVGNYVYDADGTLSGAREGHGNDLMYSIESGNENGIFSINRETGEILVARNIDRSVEILMLLVVARNIYDHSLSDAMTVKVEIDDINDKTPTFETESYTFHIREDTKIGIWIGTVSATDLDRAQNAFITYEIVESEDAETFRIDPFVGTLRLKKQLNYMYNTGYQLSVIAYDNGSPRLTGTTYVTADIIDVNDRPPKFEIEEPLIRIRENYDVGRNIYQIKAHDGDTGVGGEVLYKLISGNGNGTFVLDSESGEIAVASELDRESVESYAFVVEAEDKGTPSLTGTTTFSIIVTDVNDNTPTFTDSSYEVYLDRFSPIETHILSVSAIDIDVGDNAVVEYQISQEYEEYFQIDSKSGYIFTFSDLTAVETYIEITLIAKDRGIPSRSAFATVSIELHPPLFTEIEGFSFDVSEYASPNTFIGAVGTSPTSRYAIVNGNYKKHFRISEDDGNIFLNDVVDRERYSDYYLRVRSTHKLSPNIQTNIYVHITVTDENDNYPIFEETYYELVVLEHTPVGFSVCSITATDIDDNSNGMVTYSIINGEGGDANKIFSLNENGTLRVQSSISYEVVDHIYFTVVAKDNGQFSRRGSAQVYVQVIDNYDTIVGDTLTSTSVINFEIPIFASEDYSVGCLAPHMFGLNVTGAKVQYLTQHQHNLPTFPVIKDTGCISTKNVEVIDDEAYFLMWVVAVLKISDNARGRLALVRTDTFTPKNHVVVLTHSVSKEVLELNRNLLIKRLQSMFPSNHPRIWKMEDAVTPVQRRLLFQGSKSYVYVIRDNITDCVSGVLSKKQYIVQNDIIGVLLGPDGGVSHDLTSEDFDNFPVASVDPYRESDEHEIRWERTSAGKWILGATLIVMLLVIVFAVCVYHKKTNTNIMKSTTCRTPTPSLSVPQNTNKVDPQYNNLRRSSPKANIMPMMNALKILSGMSEKQRNKLIETTLNAKQAHTANETNVSVSKPKFITNKMKTLPPITVTHIDEICQTRKVSNEYAEEKLLRANSEVEKIAPVISKPTPPIESLPVSPTEYQLVTNCDSKQGMKDVTAHKNAQTNAQNLTSLPVPDDESLSSLDLYTMANDEDTHTKVEDTITPWQLQWPENGPIVLGGKEYDGVGKYVATGKKYIYNTRTGDKIHVSDDILKRTVEHRESVVSKDFNNDRHRVKMSTFKRPQMRRKMSKTRFSTTTIWEMNVDHVPQRRESKYDEDSGSEIGDTRVHYKMVADARPARKRRNGVDYTTKYKMKQASRLLHADHKECSAVSDLSQLGVGKTVVNKKDSIESIPLDIIDEVKKDGAAVVNVQVKPKFGHKSQINSANENRDRLLLDNKEVIYSEANATCEIGDKEDVQIISATDANENAGPYDQAQKAVKFERPIYKSLNLENISCKVPKGKSEKKDCLSKDPFYADWAKMVGRRITTKMVKKKDGLSKPVSVREGRSLPVNVAEPLVPNQFPLNMPNRHMTLDIP